MTVCRANRAGLAALVGMILPLAALAEDAAKPIYPPGFDPDTMELADPAPDSKGIKVEAKTLAAQDPDAVGALSAHNGGFAPTLWAGLSGDLTHKLVAGLPTQNPSPALRALERKLLLTAATPPLGGKPGLLDVRTAKLLAMGDFDAVTSLTAVAPAVAAGPMVQRARMENALVNASLKDACPDALRLAQSGTDPILAKLKAACLAINGQTLEANLALEPFRGKNEPDQAFVLAVEVLNGLPAPTADKIKLDQLTPLHLSLFSAARLPVPQGLLSNASPALSKTIAQAPTLSPDVRLAAAERAFAAGLLTPADLRKACLDMTFAPEDLGNPLTKAEGLGSKGLALLLRAATDQPDPLIRAGFVAKALELGQAQGQIIGTAKLFQPLLTEIKPDPALIPQAVVFARAHLILHNVLAASAWVELAKAERADLKLWPLAAIAHPEPAKAVKDGDLADWAATLAPETAPRKLAVTLGVLSGLGAKIPADAWANTLGLPAGSLQPGLFALLQSGALDARVGQTVAALLGLMGEKSLDKADPVAIAEAVSALAVLGLMDEARALATEAVLTNGI